MPFTSKKQSRWMRAAEARGEIPKGTSSRWAHHTPGGVKGLPESAKATQAIVAKALELMGKRGRRGPVGDEVTLHRASTKLHRGRKMPAEPVTRWPHGAKRPKDVQQRDLSEEGISGRPERSSETPLHGKGTTIGPGPGGGGIVGKRKTQKPYARAPKYTTLDMMSADFYGKVVSPMGTGDRTGRSFGPGPGWNQNPMPDYGDTFPGRDPKGQKKRDEAAQSNRMEANRKRNAGVMGFHGTPPKPTLRASTEERFVLSPPRESENKPRLFARVGFRGSQS